MLILKLIHSPPPPQWWGYVDVQVPGIFPEAPSHWSRCPVYSLRHHLIGPGARYIP